MERGIVCVFVDVILSSSLDLLIIHSSFFLASGQFKGKKTVESFAQRFGFSTPTFYMAISGDYKFCHKIYSPEVRADVDVVIDDELD